MNERSSTGLKEFREYMSEVSLVLSLYTLKIDYFDSPSVHKCKRRRNER